MEGSQGTSGLHCSYPSSKAGGWQIPGQSVLCRGPHQNKQKKGKKLIWYDKPLSEIENPNSHQEHTFLLGGGCKWALSMGTMTGHLAFPVLKRCHWDFFVAQPLRVHVVPPAVLSFNDRSINGREVLATCLLQDNIKGPGSLNCLYLVSLLIPPSSPLTST